MEETRYY